MDNNVAIRANNISKFYKLYNNPIDRLKESIHPFRKKYHHSFFALEDVSFVINKGETVGIVGRNGSGKSTLLKIITGVLTPSGGTVDVTGKVAALLELGAGFNPDFTGIENVYLNGAIMGYNKLEIDRRIDEILAFADIGEFIYQPVKTYSSGMLVRLAFAVQVQVEPDILIVDEALAVGDALFQKRCFQKMEQLIRRGTTLLFVSHDQETLRVLTDRAILLSEGKIKAIGTSADVLLEYRRMLHEDERAYFEKVTRRLNQRTALATTAELKPNLDHAQLVESTELSQSGRMSFGDLDAEIVNVQVLDGQGIEAHNFYPGDLLRIVVKCLVHKPLKNLNIAVRIRNKEGVKIYSWGTLNQDIAIWAGVTSSEIFWDKSFTAGQTVDVVFEAECNLGGNLYEIQAAVSEELDRYYGAQRMLHWRDEAAFFNVTVRHREWFFGGVSDMKMRAVAHE